MKILGLDLGTNSIGWALIDNDVKTIIDCGARIFPEGVNRDNLGKEVPKNMQRRLKRQTRRQLFRKKYRKHLLAKHMVRLNMFPSIPELSKTISSNDNTSIKAFFEINPYACRSRAFSGEKLSLYELGRVFYHFAQRRGYKESLKDDAADSGTLYEGDIKDGKTGINETSQLIRQYGTLGNALFNIDPAEKRWRNRYTTRKMYTDEFEIIWEKQKVFYPEVLTTELKQKIGDATEGLLFFQRPLKPQKHLIANCSLEPSKKRSSDCNIAFELRRTYEFINSIRVDNSALNQEQRTSLLELFFTKEKFSFDEIAKKLKISVFRFNYEDDKLVVGTKSISTLRKIFTPKIWNSKKLIEQEEILNIKKWAEDKEKTAAHLKKKYSLNDKQVEQFLKFKPSKGYSSLSTKATNNLLPFLEAGYLYNEAVWLGGIKNVFGESWNLFDTAKKNLIVTNALEIYDNEEHDSIPTIKEFLIKHFDVQEKQLKKLYHHSVDFGKGDGSLYQLPEPENIRNPVVQQTLFELRKLVNTIIYAYGKPEQIRVELSRELKSSIEERDKMRLKQFRNEQENDDIKRWLDEYPKPLPHTTTNIQKLKLYRELERKNGQALCPYTGENIAMHQLWNGEIDIEHIIPYSKYPDDSLSNKTLCFGSFNRKHKQNRTPFETFKDLGADAWEQAKTRALSLLPYGKYLRFIDEKQKTLDDFEARKLNDTRYISRSAKAYLEKICSKVTVTQGELTAKLRHYWGLDGILNPSIRVDLPEGEYFIAVDDERNFIEASQWQAIKKINDTNVDKLSKKGIVLQGTVKKNCFHPYKSRDDHRHHVVDAVAIACTQTSYLQKVSTMKGKAYSREEYEEREINFPDPWLGFHKEATNKINNVLISHKKRNRVITQVSKSIKTKGEKFRVKGEALRSALHAETVFGKRKDIYGNEAFHIRKSLSQITKRSQIDKIVDPAIKKLVEKAVLKEWEKSNPALLQTYKQQGLVTQTDNTWAINSPNKTKYDVPDGAFFEVIKDTTGKKIIGILPKVFLPKGEVEKGVPILKVRLQENSTGAVQLKENNNQWVEPGNNFGLLIYKDDNEEYKETIITFWEAVERKKQEAEIFSLPPDGKKIITTLQINDLFIVGLQNDEINFNNQQLLSKHLYRVQKLSSQYYVFRKANAATLDFDNEQIRLQSFKAWQAVNPVKVKIDVIGKLQKA